MTSQAEFQRQIYDRHYPKRGAAAREQLAHPLFRSFYDRLAGRILDQAPPARPGPGPESESASDSGWASGLATESESGSASNTSLRIMDIGCGEGLLAAGLSRVAGERGLDLAYSGADLSAQALELAKEAVAGGRWLQGEAEEVLAGEPDASHDVVIAKNLLHHVADPAGLLRQAARVVGPQGRVVVVEARLGCPQFWVFSGFAPRREWFFFHGARRNLKAFADAGLKVVHSQRFSWLPYELAFAIRFRIFRSLLDTDDSRRIQTISNVDDRLTGSRLTGALAAYVVWTAEPSRAPASPTNEAAEGSNSK